ncbi:MAG: SH3 domain-containing protein [Alphaproteobacteria bacterium]|nr:hypothetical protein [Alphaproteobacteria bacterium]MBO6860992.1 hypothetical protein [Alphaproteobacteria bacterium]
MRRIALSLLFSVGLGVALLSAGAPATAQSGGQGAGQGGGQGSGQPIPRMVSIKAAEANVRTGPGVDYPIRWVYRRLDMPVQVIAEFDKWRKIRDWEGDEGWVHFALLSSRRTVIVTAPETTLRRLSDEASPAVARLAEGLVARVEYCEPVWCLVTVLGYDGWLKRSDVWGIEPGETLK